MSAELLQVKKCCCNCQYLFANNSEAQCNRFDLTIRIEDVRALFCDEFMLWWGSVD